MQNKRDETMSESRSDAAKREWRDAKRHAGCVWGCLTEPFVLIALVTASMFGAYTFGRKAERVRLEQEKKDETPADD